MSVTTHERPGVYSEYDASSVVQGRQGRKMVGMAAIHATAPAGVPQTVTSYEGALIAFGSTGGQDMTELIRLALKNGAAGVVAVPVADDEGYEAAFAALAAMDDIGVVICDSVDREVQQSLRDSADLQVSGFIWLDVMKKGVDKGKALQAFQKRYGISKEETMVFGDFYNDSQMLLQAKYSFVMENANEDMKPFGNFIAPSNDDDGVMRMIKKYVLDARR